MRAERLRSASATSIIDPTPEGHQPMSSADGA
jgi:hypothetical protein